MEVVAAMNAVFTCFDELLDTFDVYKVVVNATFALVNDLVLNAGGNCGAGLYGGQWRPGADGKTRSERGRFEFAHVGEC